MHSLQYTDMSIKTSQFLLRLTGTWMNESNTEESRRRFAMSFTIALHIYSLYINLTDMYYTLDDLNHCFYEMSNVLCISLSLFKTIAIRMRYTVLNDIIILAQQNFWHFKYDQEDQILLKKCGEFCKLWTISICCIAQAASVFYVVIPIYANIGKNKSDRALPFKVWVDLPLSVTPYYEIAFATQVIALQQIGATYACHCNFLCVLNMHAIYQFRMLQRKLSSLWKDFDKETNSIDYTNNCYTALKECIRRHQLLIKFCEKLKYVYMLPILSDVVVFSILMCLNTYEILLADVSILTRFISVCHIAGNFFYIIFFTRACHGLIEESSNIGIATYSGWWSVLPMTEPGRKLRKDMRIMIMKSLRPCYLSAGGFFPVSLETTTALMSSTLSYFTLMRESSMRMASE
ncbi:PREDICTED: odorant receptor Or2-like [Eufriesea mexicana]|uniref:odorant receptor Or2-like n=1 Tax=Eufriesea mexicana TaxID=516756 RepID=UPI00083C0B73|nr:PREDICTED: odorant receptor Or2-like [Eufriesea mexicana]